jgi:hypothetical protein
LLAGSSSHYELEPREGEVYPGERQPVKVGMQLSPGSDKKLVILLETNDPRSPFAEYWVLGSGNKATP